MLKARAIGNDGKILYLLGLSARNREQLLAGDPIHFDGAEVGEPGAHFLITWAPNAKVLERLRRHFAYKDPRYLYTLGLDQGVLQKLHLEPGRIPGLRGGAVDVVVFAAETEQDMAAMLGVYVPPVASGFRDEFDPVTGLVRRVPVPRPS